MNYQASCRLLLPKTRFTLPKLKGILRLLVLANTTTNQPKNSKSNNYDRLTLHRYMQAKMH